MSKDEFPLKTPSTGDLPEVDQELSQVGVNPKQSILILVVVIAIFGYLFFNLFISSNDNDKKTDTTPLPTQINKPSSQVSDNDIPEIPTLPAPPKLEEPTPPLPPIIQAEAGTSAPTLPPKTDILPLPDLSPPPSLPTLKVKDDDLQKKLEAKRKSSIVLLAGTAPTKTPDQLQQEADFSYRGDMNIVLGRGKIIDAIIETAINSDFGGEIRAIITKDIYSEWGKNILLPKGSRVIGNYATGMSGAYGRVSIEWTRIDLANGYTLNLSGSGIDNLGRKGNQGRVDNKFKERFSNAILRSAFNIVLAKTMDSIVPPVASNQTAAAQAQISTRVTSLVTTINAQPAAVTSAVKGAQICAQVPATITDITSSLFTQVTAACTIFTTNPGGLADDLRLNTLVAAVTAATASTAVTAAAATQPSLAQAASTQAVTDVSDTVKELMDSQEFKPTITIDQGTPVKIYVNKDYKFPKAAIKRSQR